MKSLLITDKNLIINNSDNEIKFNKFIKRKYSSILKMVIHFSFKDISFEKKKMLSFFFILEILTNQKGILTKSSKNITFLGVRKGFPTGVKVNLQNKNLYNWLDTLLLTLPRNDNFAKILINSTSLKKGASSFSFLINELSFFYQIEKLLISYISRLNINWVSLLNTWQENIFLLTNLYLPIELKIIQDFQKNSLQKHFYKLTKNSLNDSKNYWNNWISECNFFFNYKKIYNLFTKLDFILFFFYEHLNSAKRIQLRNIIEFLGLKSVIIPSKILKFLFRTKKMFFLSSITKGNIIAIFKQGGGFFSKKEFTKLNKISNFSLIFGIWNGYLYRPSKIKQIFFNFENKNKELLKILNHFILKFKANLFYFFK